MDAFSGCDDAGYRQQENHEQYGQWDRRYSFDEGRAGVAQHRELSQRDRQACCEEEREEDAVPRIEMSSPRLDRGRAVRDEGAHRQVQKRGREHHRGEATEGPRVDLPIDPDRPPEAQVYRQQARGPEGVDPVTPTRSQQRVKALSKRAVLSARTMETATETNSN